MSLCQKTAPCKEGSAASCCWAGCQSHRSGGLGPETTARAGTLHVATPHRTAQRRPQWRPRCRPGARARDHGQGSGERPCQEDSDCASRRPGNPWAGAAHTGCAPSLDSGGQRPRPSARGPWAREARAPHSSPNEGPHAWLTGRYGPHRGAESARVRRSGGGPCRPLCRWDRGDAKWRPQQGGHASHARGAGGIHHHCRWPCASVESRWTG
jgi:hypothetical protein